MNLIEKINNLFSYDRYYRMSTEEIAEENKKNHLTVYGDNFVGRREMMLKQLIAKDNASMFKKSLIISISTLIVVIISLIISVIAICIK